MFELGMYERQAIHSKLLSRSVRELPAASTICTDMCRACPQRGGARNGTAPERSSERCCYGQAPLQSQVHQAHYVGCLLSGTKQSKAGLCLCQGGGGGGADRPEAGVDTCAHEHAAHNVGAGDPLRALDEAKPADLLGVLVSIGSVCRRVDPLFQPRPQSRLQST